jgi:hypothetical protein
MFRIRLRTKKEFLAAALTPARPVEKAPTRIVNTGETGPKPAADTVEA